MYYFIDLDDTLVNTTILNNDAYNFALEKFGFPRIETNKRITRKDLHIDKETLSKVIEAKQNYFIQDWLKYRIIVNQELIDIIKRQDKNKCFIWTKANKNRAYAVIKQCGLYNYFKDVIFDNKNDFEVSIQKLRQLSNGENFTICDDDNYFKGKKTKIANLKNSNFDISVYNLKTKNFYHIFNLILIKCN